MKIFKNFSKNWKIWIWIISVILAIIAINPNPFAEGVRVKYIGRNASERIRYLQRGDKILSINNKEIKNAQDFRNVLNSLEINQTIFIDSSRGSIQSKVQNKSGYPYLGLEIENIPKTNIKMGLDLEGGVRLILKPLTDEKHPKITKELTEQISRTLSSRLNTYGLKDIRIMPALVEGEWQIFVEISGITKEEAIDLLTTQGKFEAKIGEESIFTGEDVVMVYLDPQHSKIGKINENSYQWSFTVEINKKAAKAFSKATKDLSTITDPITGESHLNKSLTLYIDGKNVSSLRISSKLKGKEYNTPMISGGARTIEKARKEMKKMQSYFRYTLPVEVEIIGIPASIPPALGEEFTKKASLAIFMAFATTTGLLYIRYRDYRISLLILATSISELVLTLGVASLINWNIDLASIAGLIAAVGTGVNDQIVITDDVSRGIKQKYTRMSKRVVEAMKIIFRSAFTIILAMIPLAWIGFGILRGFAITTIIGVLVGIFITRPGYINMLERLYKK